MIAEKLRKSILQAAIQGKLTEQLPEDGDARDLLAAIKAEKAQLIKEGKIKKEKPLPEITEEEIPFEIPENWCWVRLPEVGELARGKSKHRPRNDNILYENGCYPMIQTGDVARTNRYITTFTTCYNEVGLAQSKLWEKGTLCLTIAANIGDVAILTFDACFPDSIVGFNAFLPINSNKYFLYMLSAYKYPLDNLSRSTAQKNINLEILASIPIPLPPLAEQHRIVNKIETLLSELDKLEKDEIKLDLLQKSFPKKMKDSLLQAAIQGKLTEQLDFDGDARDLVADIKKEKKRLIKEGKIKKEKPLPEIAEDEILFEIPENWCWCYLQEVSLRVHYGYTASAKSVGKVKLLRITDIQDNVVRWENVPYCDISEEQKENYKLQERDIVVARTGGTIGKTYIVRDLPDIAVFASYLIRIIPSEKVSEEYLKYFMESDLYWKQLAQKSQGTGQPNVNGESLKRLMIPFPPLVQQQKIVERLKRILPLCEALEEP